MFLLLHLFLLPLLALAPRVLAIYNIFYYIYYLSIYDISTLLFSWLFGLLGALAHRARCARATTLHHARVARHAHLVVAVS